MPLDPRPRLYTLPEPVSLDDVIVELVSMPAALREAVFAQPAATLIAASRPGEWNAFQTVCHFRDAALVYATRFRYMVFNHDPLLPNYDENSWVEAARDTPADLPAILDEVAASRSDLVRMLTRLDDATWRRTGRHELAGTLVLEDYVRHQLAHERMHLAQIRGALAAAEHHVR